MSRGPTEHPGPQQATSRPCLAHRPEASRCRLWGTRVHVPVPTARWPGRTTTATYRARAPAGLSAFSAPSCFNSLLSKVGSYLPFISIDNKNQFKVHTILKAGIPSPKPPPYPLSLSSWQRGRDLTRHGPTVLEAQPRHWPRCPDSWFWGRWAGILQPLGPEGRRDTLSDCPRKTRHRVSLSHPPRSGALLAWPPSLTFSQPRPGQQIAGRGETTTPRLSSGTRDNLPPGLAASALARLNPASKWRQNMLLAARSGLM